MIIIMKDEFVNVRQNNHLIYFLLLSYLSISLCEMKNTNLLDYQSNESDQSHDEDKPNERSEQVEMTYNWKTNPLLPTSVTPDLYDLTLYPNLTTGTFSGKVRIILKVVAPASNVILHHKGLSIEKTELTSHNSSDNYVKQAFDFFPHEFWVLELKDKILPGSYNLELTFSGSLTKNIVGFYRSVYKDVSTGSNRSIATTKFEPTYARQAFPCFDEPRFKAEFKISLVRPTSDNYIALSNMNVMSEVADSPSVGLTTVNFKTSVKMSTYLACFIVCDFGKLPPIMSKKNFPISVYARHGQLQYMQFALDLAAKTIEYYIDYFEIDYPLPKLDLIAIPDFVSGAMENWGLITFRETSVLYNNETTSATTQFNIAMTVTHELAHMWFGNLVTMKWWDDLWLNEGFASFMQFKGTHNAFPDWDVDIWFLDNKLHPVLDLDATLSSHPIIQRVSHPDQITEIFDTISYYKGSSVIRMLEHFVGEENFRKGIVSYLNAFQFNNAETSNLWTHLEKFSNGLNLTRIMGTWTRQKGYPVINVERKGNTLTFTQSRFLSDKEASYDPSESPYNYKWDVPISYITSDSQEEQLTWLMMDDQSVTLDVGSASWVKLNKHQKFYYRVNYGENGWSTISNVLLANHKVIGAGDRANLINDAFSLAEAGYIDYLSALNLTKYMENETHPVPWSVTADILISLRNKLLHKPEYSKYQEYVWSIVGPHISEATWKISQETNFTEKRLAVELLNLGCSVGLPACRNKTKQLFLQWLQDSETKIDAQLTSIVYFYGMKECGEAEWEELWKKFVNTTEPQDRMKLQNALSAINNPSKLSKFIYLAKHEEFVRSQDYFSVLASISRNPIGLPIVWDWIRENWDYLVNRFTLNDRSFGRLLPAVTKNFDSNIKLQELQAFLKLHPEEGAGAAGRKTALENIKLNIKWNEKNYESLRQFLKM